MRDDILLEQRDAVITALEEQNQRCLATIDRLQKECATCCLQLLASAFIGTIDEGLTELVKGKTDKDVLSLVIGHHMHPLGVCARCERPAPVIEVEQEASGANHPDDSYTVEVCSWGCPR